MRTLAELAAGTACALLIAGCTAVAQQKAQPPRPDDYLFHNLQVLPQNVTRDELITTMRRFTQALGVKCDFCHAPRADNPRELDFPSDAKTEKASARIMIRMVQTINQDYVAHVEEVYTTVSCWTCHRGQTQPDVVPALPPEEEHD